MPHHRPTKLDVGIDIKVTEPYDRQRWTASPPPTLPESSPPGGSPTSACQSSPIRGVAVTIQCRHHRRDRLHTKAPSTVVGPWTTGDLDQFLPHQWSASPWWWLRSADVIPDLP